MKVLLDVNVVVDICTLREPFYTESVAAVDWMDGKGISKHLYAGSVQTMQFVLMSELVRRDKKNNIKKNNSFYEEEAKSLLYDFTDDLVWVSALSEDGHVYNDVDPEDAQLIKAVNRMGHDAVILTRDKGLLERFDKAISPKQFLSEYAGKEIDRQIPFCDLKKQLDEYRPELEDAVFSVLESTAFINGPAVKNLAEDLSSFSGVKYSVPCASGTDAILLALMALNVEPGDEIIVPAFTFIATASMVSFYKAVPVFADVDPVAFTIDPGEIEGKITSKTVGIIPVSLYGQCAPMDEINEIAEKHGLWVLEDAAQSFGAEYKEKKSCSLSKIATTSFFPAKPLGCYGDGGAVFTSDDTLAEKVRLFANHGQAKRYYHSRIGINGRMDSIQAAVVRAKLKHFADEIRMRNNVAEMYTERLKDVVKTPVVLDNNLSTWAQYTIQSEKRDSIREHLNGKGIPTAIHYPMSLPRQEAFSYLNTGKDFPVSDRLSNQVMSLPIHPFLTEQEIDLICSAIKEVL